jgi:hypothetical protein
MIVCINSTYRVNVLSFKANVQVSITLVTQINQALNNFPASVVINASKTFKCTSCFIITD